MQFGSHSNSMSGVAVAWHAEYELMTDILCDDTLCSERHWFLQ